IPVKMGFPNSLDYTVFLTRSSQTSTDRQNYCIFAGFCAMIFCSGLNFCTFAGFWPKRLPGDRGKGEAG
ncbi:hypothetical protein, partial [Paenibacillus cisolokensis]|uniref:hypothetical protein n=1 Tax=Paenibacillus cisolokensis TaxID=1658519 RepID=UPI001BD02A0C